MGKFFARLFALGFIALLIAGAGVGYLLFQGNTDGEIKEVLIPRGASLGIVAQILTDQQVIQRPKIFKYLLSMTQGSQRVRAGEFRFRTNSRMIDALNTLYRQEPVVHSVTLPEGWTVRQYADILQGAKLVDAARFLKLTLTPEAAAKYNFKAPTLEGYLFPDTYAFSKIDGEEKIIETLVKRFKQKFVAEHAAEMQQKGWTLERLVTLASIIEKETGVGGERGKVSSVFHNRMAKKMRLQSDPTTIYGIDHFNGNLTRADLQRYSPYNTYTIPELPPGAICNPGLEALVAGLRPLDTPYLYFVGNNKGEHVFSETYQQHARYVNELQKNPTVRRIGQAEAKQMKQAKQKKRHK